ELAEVALEQEGAEKHDEEADEAEEKARGEGGDEQAEAGDEAESRPLQVAARVLVQGGRADLARECRVVLVELLLDLLEDSLLVLGQRHYRLATSSLSSGGAPTNPSSRSVPMPTTRDAASCPAQDRFSLPGPHCCSPRRFIRRPPSPTRLAGPAASGPKRCRTSSTALVASSHGGTASSSVSCGACLAARFEALTL